MQPNEISLEEQEEPPPVGSIVPSEPAEVPPIQYSATAHENVARLGPFLTAVAGLQAQVAPAIALIETLKKSKDSLQAKNAALEKQNREKNDLIEHLQACISSMLPH